MSQLSLCPNILFFNCSVMDPCVIEQEIINPLVDLLDKIADESIKILISNHIIEMLDSQFPWNKCDDPQWKGFVNNWYISCITKIYNHIEIKEHTVNDTGIQCSHLPHNLNNIFFSFLSTIHAKKICSKFLNHGIFTLDSSSCQGSICPKYQLINKKDINQCHFIKYPWLAIYDSRLPYKGEYTFTPQSHWITVSAPIKGKKFGYLDINNDEWVWDTLHNDHWDVQYNCRGTGNYIRITEDGRKLS